VVRRLVLLAAVLAGCADPRYAERFAAGTDPDTVVSRADARLRELLGKEPSPGDASRLLDPLCRKLTASTAPGASVEERLRAVREALDGIAPSLAPVDSELVPSLAWSARRAGCVPLAWAWSRLGAAAGVELVAVPLPGHVALATSDGRLLEPLRGGLERSRAFYDSAFGLADRPAYRALRGARGGIQAALLVQCGLLEWKAGRLARAQEAFEAALSWEPGLPEAEGNLGLVLEARGDREGALRHLDRALEGDPAHRAARARRDALAGVNAPATPSDERVP